MVLGIKPDALVLGPKLINLENKVQDLLDKVTSNKLCHEKSNPCYFNGCGRWLEQKLCKDCKMPTCTNNRWQSGKCKQCSKKASNKPGFIATCTTDDRDTYRTKLQNVTEEELKHVGNEAILWMRDQQELRNDAIPIHPCQSIPTWNDTDEDDRWHVFEISSTKPVARSVASHKLNLVCGPSTMTKDGWDIKNAEHRKHIRAMQKKHKPMIVIMHSGCSSPWPMPGDHRLPHWVRSYWLEQERRCQSFYTTLCRRQAADNHIFIFVMPKDSQRQWQPNVLEDLLWLWSKSALQEAHLRQFGEIGGKSKLPCKRPVVMLSNANLIKPSRQ